MDSRVKVKDVFVCILFSNMLPLICILYSCLQLTSTLDKLVSDWDFNVPDYCLSYTLSHVTTIWAQLFVNESVWR